MSGLGLDGTLSGLRESTLHYANANTDDIYY